MIIYKMTNKVNGKVYIGQTTRELDERTKEHIRHNEIIVDKAIQKYGIENFTVEQIDLAENIDELNQKEMHWIEHYDCITPKGYNQCYGGNNTCGYHHKEESKQKMSIKKSQNYIGEGNPFYNKTHSEESRKKMSEARKGLKHLTEEQIKRLRESHHTVKVINVDTGEVFDSIKDAGLKYNIEPTHITRVCKGKRKTCGGYRWEYVKNL